MKWFLVFLFLLIGCGENPTPSTHNQFTAHQEKFNQLALGYGVMPDTNVLIVFGATTGKGMCLNNYVPKRIYIDSKFWYAYSTNEADREQLIFHELGLCALGRTLVSDCSVSIMCPYMIPTSQYQLNYNSYIYELFNGF